jgi:hypothetical protein
MTHRLAARSAARYCATRLGQSLPVVVAAPPVDATVVDALFEAVPVDVAPPLPWPTVQS